MRLNNLMPSAQDPDWDKIRKEAEAKKAALEAQKAAAEAEKAVYDARKAKADASLAALKAKIPDVPDSGIKGEVPLTEKAGVIEAQLLSAKALGEAAGRLAEQLPNLNGKTVLLYAPSELPGFQALVAYRAQSAIVDKAFADAAAVSKSAMGQAPPAREVAPLAAAGLVLDAVTKLLGFFRSLL